MKKLAAALIILFVLLTIAGCVDVKTKIKVNKDGSGTVEETVLMSTEMIQMLKQFVSGFADDSTNVEEFKLYNEGDIKNRAADFGDGVQFSSGKELQEDGREGYVAVYTFEDLNKLRFDQNPGSKMPEQMADAEVKEKEYITFSFSRNNDSEIIISMPPVSKEKEEDEEKDEEVDSSSDSLDTQDLSRLKFLMKDFNISLVIEAEGYIIETNANYVDRSSVTLFDLNFNLLLDEPERLEALKKINPNDMQELKEVIKDVPGIRIETNDPVKIRFR